MVVLTKNECMGSANAVQLNPSENLIPLVCEHSFGEKLNITSFVF